MDSVRTRPARLVWFSWWWALAVLLHTLQAWPVFGGMANPSWLALWEYVAAAAALVLIVRPLMLPALVVMSLGIFISAWMAAPLIGNHWMISALLSLGFLGTLAHALVRRTGLVVDALMRSFLPVARGVFLVFYTFSALAKINRGFVDPITSCATFFADQTAHSLGWQSLDTAGSGGVGRTIAVAVIVIELSVVLLLVLRRTRVWGVLLAVVFHGLIGLDGTHSFADFTALVYAFLILFLPERFFERATDLMGRVRGARAVHTVVRCVLAGLIVVLIVLLGSDDRGRTWSWVGDVRDVVWWVVTATVVLAVVGILVVGRERTRPESLVVLPTMRWLVVVPLIAGVNGVLPYAGLKTAYSWNMYSNLVTAPGYENGLLIPTGWGWDERQADLVQILDSSDPGLLQYRDDGYLIPMVMLRAYTSGRPSISLVYRRGDAVFTVDEVARDPELSKPVPALTRKLGALRSVDATRPARCQDRFLPAL